MSIRFFLVAVILLVLSACSDESSTPAEPAGVTSHLAGTFSVDAAVDSVADYSGFEVLVAVRDTTGALDTLGYAETDRTGRFAMTVKAPDRGVYPLLVRRRGQTLAVDELAVAQGDSATVRAVFPVGNRPLRIRSAENAAWLAYRNAKAQYNTTLAQLVQSGAYDDAQAAQNVQQTAAILWSLRTTFPSTVGSDVASAEAVALLAGWDDSLAVERAREIEARNPSFAQAARVARQATARHAGQDAALAELEAFAARAETDEARAAIQSEVVMAYADSLARDEALAAARALAADFPGTTWAGWAERAIYELETLAPGQEAPDFTVQTAAGAPLALADLLGQVTILEFYAPGNAAFLRDVPARNALAEAAAGAPFAIVSYSLQPDTLINEAFLDGQPLPGVHVFAPDDQGYQSALPRLYNVNALPTRYLIDRDGRIVGKYVGGAALPALQRDALALLAGA